MPNNPQMGPVYFGDGGTPENMNVASLAYSGQLGMKVTIKQPPRSAPTAAGVGRSKTYQIVRTDSTMTTNPFDGAVAWWSDETQYMVTTSPTALGRGRIAGVFRNAVTPGYYTCVQTQGPGKVKFIDAVAAAPTVAGLFVIPSATAAKADTLAAGTAATYPTLGVTAGAYDAPAAEATVDLDVPETT